MRTIRIGFHLMCYLVLFAALVQVAKASDTAVQSTDEVLKAMELQKSALSDKESELAEREKALQRREQDLDEKIRKLENLRASIRQDMDDQKKNNEDRVLKLVAVMETMTPKSASGVLETIDDGLAVEVLKRIETKRMAKILNIMDKARSAKLSELMTGYYNPNLVGQAGSRGVKASRLPAQIPENAPVPSQSAPKAVAPAEAFDSKKGGNK